MDTATLSACAVGVMAVAIWTVQLFSVCCRRYGCSCMDSVTLPPCAVGVMAVAVWTLPHYLRVL